MALFNHAVTWLRKNRVLLPGVSVLARQVSEAHTTAERRLYEAVVRAAHRADSALAPAPAELLLLPEGKRISELERLRTPPMKSTGTAIVRAMQRVEEISAFALGRVNLSRVPVNRLSTLVRYGQLSKAQTLERAPEPRRTALLTAVVRHEREQYRRHDSAAERRAGEHIVRVMNPHQHTQQRGSPGQRQRDRGEAGPQHGETGGQGGVVARERPVPRSRAFRDRFGACA